ncbi:hypothetical protein LTR08_005970 [Meristemomyces frigidus]|nr:hypothetical protein LTR08_005970 [Meristemomyces frigidus]
MPDARPLSSLRPGDYDDPPSSESSTPRTRRDRLRQALHGTDGLARDNTSTADTLVMTGDTLASTVEAARRTRDDTVDTRRVASLLSPLNRRRQRSPSDPADEVATRPGPPVEEAIRRRRSKRRKLDLDVPTAKPGIKYGHFGQVEPGRLSLDLISCDGGEHVDPRHHDQYLGAKNLLRHDKSVYCSARPNTNIILRHADDTPFCLEKLHIVGPEHGFTAPVREGLVYVAMNIADLQKYLDPPAHARLRNINTPPYRRRREQVDSLRSSPERLSLSDALRDPEVSAVLDRRERGYANGADLAHDLASTGDSYYGQDFGFGRTDAEAHCDIPTVTSSEEANGLAEPENGHVPVAILSDEDAGPEERSSQEVLDFRLQRLRSMRRRHEIENWDRDGRWSGVRGLRFEANSDRSDRDGEGSQGLSRLDTLMARSHVFDSPARDSPLSTTSNMSTSAHPPSGTSNPVNTGRGVEHDADRDDSVTCARFQITKHKHKVAIKFEPGVSGRFILLKLWANKSNVDVQSIIAKGYGGCRFFPARSFA